MAKNKQTKNKLSQKEAEKLIASGEAEIPAEAIVKSSSEKSDYASHPKFDKFKSSQGAE